MRANLTLKVAVTMLASVALRGQDSQPKPSPAPIEMRKPGALSPDQKWEYASGDAPKLVKAGTHEVAVNFSEESGLGGIGENSAILWAPDSRRFAIYSGQGKENLTVLFQLRDDHWVAAPALGDGDGLMQVAGDVINAQAKKKGLPKKTFLHMNSWTVKPDRWLDANTLMVYASMVETAHTSNGEYAGDGFAADLLVTLKIDAGGKWKIAATRRMSPKEVEKMTNER